MSDTLDVHDYHGRVQREIQNITAQTADGKWRVPREQDRDDLRLFADDMQAQLSPSTASDDIARVRRLAEILPKPLRECTVDDIKLR